MAADFPWMRGIECILRSFRRRELGVSRIALGLQGEEMELSQVVKSVNVSHQDSLRSKLNNNVAL